MTTTTESTLTREAIVNFHSSLLVSGCSSNTARAYRSDLTGFLDWTSTTGPAMPQQGLPMEMFDKTAATWLNETRKEAAPKTTCRRLTSLRKFAEYAGHPCPTLDKYKPPLPGRAVPHPIPEGIAGVMAMITVANQRDHKCLCALTGLLGLRVSEARSVRSVDIDVHDMTLTVRGKGDRERTVPISPTAWTFIAPVWSLVERNGGGLLITLSDRTARDTITRLAKRAKLSRHVASHDMRATLGTAAYEKTKDIRAVQEVLGHASVETTQVYTRVSMKNMRQAVEGLE